MKNKPNTAGVCANCDNEFSYYLSPKHVNEPRKLQKYCSYKCSTKRPRATRKIKKNCLNCGKLIMVPPHILERKKYCSKICKSNYEIGKKRKVTSIEKVCPICSEQFTASGSHRFKQVYCSIECGNRGKSSTPKNIWTEITCLQCGKIVRKRTYRIKDAEKSFCSRPCHRKWVGEHRQDYYMTIECLACHKPFEIQKWFVTVRGDAKFCSRKCLDYHNSISKMGPLNVNWKGGDVNSYGPNWNFQKRLVRKRDNYQCRLCGYREDRRRLDVHHRVPFRTFGYIVGVNDRYISANDERNLILLCRTCHKKSEHHPELIAHLL